MKLIFIRHGADDDNFRGGWSDLGLVDEGQRQSEAVAMYLANSNEYDIGYILSSDLNRATETAQIIASSLNLPLYTAKEVRETNNGDLAGMPNSEALIKYPALFWNTLEMNERYPNGESPHEFYSRIRTWFEHFISNPPISEKDILIVTHGGVINIIYYLIKELVWTNTKTSFPISQCSIHVLDIDHRVFILENKVVWE